MWLLKLREVIYFAQGLTVSGRAMSQEFTFSKTYVCSFHYAILSFTILKTDNYKSSYNDNNIKSFQCARTDLRYLYLYLYIYVCTFI